MKLLVVSLILSTVITIPVRAQVLDYTTRITAEPGKLVTERTVLIQVNDKTMDALADVTISYLGEDEIEILDASLLDGNGKRIRDISKKEIKTRHDIDEGIFFSDDWVKEFKVVGLGYPYRILYRYRTTRRKFTRICFWFPTVFVNYSTLRASLEITTPNDYPLLIEQNFLTEPEVRSQGKSTTRTWTTNQMGPFQVQTFGLPIGEQLPHVVVAPVQFDYILKGNNSSWAQYGTWLTSLVDGTADLPQEEKFRLWRLLEGITDTHEKVRRLYHHLQDNTRYVAVEVDEGGLKPFPASFVSTKKYGDCKALTVYMRALLLEAGIPSFYAPVYGNEDPVRGGNTVQAKRFNHVILCVPTSQDTMWIESTAGYLPYGYLGTFTQGRDVLVVDGGNSRLTKTPALSKKDVRRNDVYHFTLSGDGNGSIEISREFRGRDFETLRYFLHNKSNKEATDFVRDGLQLKDFRILQQQFEPIHRDSCVLSVRITASLSNQFRNLAGTMAFSPPKFGLPALESPAQRKGTLRFPYPAFRTSTISYKVDLGKDQAIELPSDVNLTSPFGSYSIAYHTDPSGVTVKKELSLHAGDYALDQYPALYAFLDRINQSEKQYLLINKTSK